MFQRLLSQCVPPCSFPCCDRKSVFAFSCCPKDSTQEISRSAANVVHCRVLRAWEAFRFHILPPLTSCNMFSIFYFQSSNLCSSPSINTSHSSVIFWQYQSITWVIRRHTVMRCLAGSTFEKHGLPYSQRWYRSCCRHCEPSGKRHWDMIKDVLPKWLCWQKEMLTIQNLVKETCCYLDTGHETWTRLGHWGNINNIS